MYQFIQRSRGAKVVTEGKIKSDDNKVSIKSYSVNKGPSIYLKFDNK